MKFPYKIIDLTHTLEASIPSWNGRCGFEQTVKLNYDLNDKETLSFRVQQLKMHAGIGTHIDAPAHCSKGILTVDQLDLAKLIAPCVMIDRSSKADENYRLSLAEVKAFEKTHGLIKPGSFVIIRTGWDQFWKEPKRYHNNHLFPSVSRQAAELFLEREITGLGIDTLSPDKPQDGFPVHEILLGSGKYIIENVANAASLPPLGAFTLALPIKTKEGTEAPIRLVALVEEVQENLP